MCYYVTTAKQYWGKGDTLKEAMHNARLIIETLPVVMAQSIESHLFDVAYGDKLEIDKTLQWAKKEYIENQKDIVPEKIRFHVIFAHGWKVLSVDGMGSANWVFSDAENKTPTEFKPLKLQLVFNTKTGEITVDKEKAK